jgi:hemerythrin
MNHALQHPYLEQALADHRDLHRRIATLRCRLECCVENVTKSDFDNAVASLRDLRNRLQAHFAREEAGGYLDEAISRMPRLASKADRLQRQHAQFVTWADRILQRAVVAEPWQSAWEELRDEFSRLAARIETHEYAEDELLSKAFNVAVDAPRSDQAVSASPDVEKGSTR